MKDEFIKIFKDVDRVLCVFAHPDDAEIICGGTMVRLIDQGKEIRLVVTTNGNKGLRDRTDISIEEFGKQRLSEQFKAAISLGIKENEIFNLEIPDGEFEDNLKNIEKIVKHIREFKPDIIVTHNPEEVINSFSKSSHWVNHRDHRNTAKVVMDAIYPYSRDRGFFPEHFSRLRLFQHSVKKILISDSYQHPDRKYFEIGKYKDRKARAIALHKSAIDAESVEEYIEENKYGEKYFEVLRFVEIY